MSESATEVETGAHEVRITLHGKMQTWVGFALDFLAKNETRPLVLHTLPAKRDKESGPEDADKDQVKRGLPPSTAAVPRLISVVEIIKREFVKLDGTPEERTLHQYNEVGCLDEDEPPTADETGEQARRDALMKALEGKHHLRISKTPYMRVTLCRKEVPGLNATYQGAVAKRLSRSAKARAKKRAAE